MSLTSASISAVFIFAGVLCLPLVFVVRWLGVRLPEDQREIFYCRWSPYLPTYADGVTLIAMGFVVLLLRLLLGGD